MKIICVGLNYKDHITEMGLKEPSEPIIFMKPDTALLRNNDPLYIPHFTSELEYEAEIVVKICRIAKGIPQQFAHRCYNELAVGIDFTARDLQRKAMAAGEPWELSKAFDHSTAVPNTFIDKSELGDLAALPFHLNIDGATVQSGNSANMLFSVDEIISYVSQFVTLKIGDLIFTGTPVGVGAVKAGNHIEAYLADKKMLDFEIR